MKGINQILDSLEILCQNFIIQEPTIQSVKQLQLKQHF